MEYWTLIPLWLVFLLIVERWLPRLKQRRRQLEAKKEYENEH